MSLFWVGHYLGWCISITVLYVEFEKNNKSLGTKITILISELSESNI